MDVFLKQVEAKPNNRFLGTRAANADGTFGDYEWMNYKQVHTIYEEIAKGSKALGLMNVVPGIDEDGKEWSFTGIWSKNRWEWHTVLLCAMVNRSTVIGFYDSMGDDAVEYCLN